MKTKKNRTEVMTIRISTRSKITLKKLAQKHKMMPATILGRTIEDCILYDIIQDVLLHQINNKKEAINLKNHFDKIHENRIVIYNQIAELLNSLSIDHIVPKIKK